MSETTSNPIEFGEPLPVPEHAWSRLTRKVCGGYSHTDWAVVDGAGEIVPNSALEHNRFVVIENAYDCVLLACVRHPTTGELCLVHCYEENK